MTSPLFLTLAPIGLSITHKWGSGFKKFLVAQVFNLCEGFSHSLERLCHQAEKLVGKDNGCRAACRRRAPKGNFSVRSKEK